MVNAEPSRDPGAEIKEKLRREVNFGCPVSYPQGRGWGSPILTHHHFDPPWADNFVHNIDGMVALCPEHHNQADGGLWTIQQLRQFKTRPYVDSAIKCLWPWTAEKLVTQFGPNLTIGQGSPLWLYERPILGFRPAENQNLGIRSVMFDSYVENRSGRRWIEIEDGWFNLAVGSTHDLIFTPQLRLFPAHNKDGTDLTVRYRRVPVSEFKNWWADFNRDKRFNRDIRYDSPEKIVSKFDIVDSDNCIPIMKVTGSFVTNHVSAHITGRKTTFQCLMPGYSGKEGFVNTWPGMIFNTTEAIRFVDHTQREFVRLG